MIVMETKNLGKIYSFDSIKVTALNNVSIQINQGEIVGIMGPSGSGKSTLMNLVGCLDRPSQGEIWIAGSRVDNLNDNNLAIIRSKQVGFVFQNYNLLPRLKVIENVELPLIYQGVPSHLRRKKADEVLERIGLKERMHHKPSQISGGEQQRVALARALVTNPSFILADEPTGNLDSKTGKEIIKLLQDLNNGGVTVLLITHDRFVAEHTARVIHLKDGEVIENEALPNPIREV
ncbi:MAG: putative ABC transporter ATP-binding protein YknY [candidate division WS2 bacterium]|uniref:ABC transporter ATP-binding protein YknY n=1 Tax=Psychracetigena formicireducens TaxID=2986056 RepID=A0A9E2BJN6_PSYF1|nr:putative ABC transporter ATP-binding protein YknY [Candidatus Psychracetigena formicireducens]MBT9145705.1 putative ABC transporter ATP-binding protein YknY [Candidatus Psychracetigena formicireducens]MBT9151653.1 putative ABC transporter ATP-binding protein YknY [Candidatus Psychracetigena formicireducens]